MNSTIVENATGKLKPNVSPLTIWRRATKLLPRAWSPLASRNGAEQCDTGLDVHRRCPARRKKNKISIRTCDTANACHLIKLAVGGFAALRVTFATRWAQLDELICYFNLMKMAQMIQIQF